MSGLMVRVGGSTHESSPTATPVSGKAPTTMALDRWRTQLRLRAALPLLAEGHPVARVAHAVAHAVGYATPSAFLAAFRRTVGTTPQRYLRGAETPPAPSPGP
ncbi:hypothetical protein GCM10010442_58870 [Kitasatospora kifunensis]|uniref:AraC-like DNA-binding protein n=1 Tax=Kitasatospora kifunensis TaxID=58351 RepID=A0A7W7VYG4_KITKI|nr:AraC-like DNA-binding protein [Kitasatospora kifunensis]